MTFYRRTREASARPQLDHACVALARARGSRTCGAHSLEARQPRPVSATTARSRRSDLRAHQVPDHDGRPRPERQTSSRRSEADTFRRSPATLEPRRAPHPLERHPRRHEPGRSASLAGAVPRPIHSGTKPPPRSRPWNHRLGANQRSERDHLGREVRARRLVRRKRVAPNRSSHTFPNRGAGVSPTRHFSRGTRHDAGVHGKS